MYWEPTAQGLCLGPSCAQGEAGQSSNQSCYELSRQGRAVDSGLLSQTRLDSRPQLFLLSSVLQQ